MRLLLEAERLSAASGAGRLGLVRSPAGELGPQTLHHGTVEIPCEALPEVRRRTLQHRLGQTGLPSQMITVMRDRLVGRRRHVEEKLAQVCAALRAAERLLD